MVTLKSLSEIVNRFFGKKDSSVQPIIPVVVADASNSEWKCLAEKHVTAKEKITVAGFGMDGNISASEKQERLNYMYLQLHQVRDKKDRVISAERILIATTHLDMSSDVLMGSAIFYAVEACDVIYTNAPHMLANPDVVIKVVETGIKILSDIIEKNKQQELIYALPYRVLKEFIELHGNLQVSVLPLNYSTQFIPH